MSARLPTPAQRSLTRRDLLRAALTSVAALPLLGPLGVACAPAAPTSKVPPDPAAATPGGQAPATGKASWQADWDALVAAATQEGKISVMTTAGSTFPKWLQTTGEAFSGITVEHQQQPTSDQIGTKVLAERQAGVYTYDLLLTAPVVALPRLRPEGVLEDMRPLLFRPDVLDESAWSGGFTAGWQDANRGLGYALTDSLTKFSIDTDQVGENDLKSAQDLLDPKWKGKIIMGDVRASATFVLMTSIRLALGEDAVKRLVIDQQPAFTRDVRQIAEGLVRGRYAIGFGIGQTHLQEFLDAGLGQNVQFVDVADASFISNTYSLWVVNQAPHPNAAKLFANWILTKEGQQVYSSINLLNSRRTDVPVVDLTTVPRPGQHYLYSGHDDALPEIEKTQELLAQLKA